MTIPAPPYLLEYRAARALMASGNIGPAKLIDMLDNGDAFFFDGDRKDFKACPLCKSLLNTHPECFVKSVVADMKLRGALVGKLIDGGTLTLARIPLAEGTIKMVAVASREGLNCVMVPNSIVWDNFAACSVAKVTAIEVDDFIGAL